MRILHIETGRHLYGGAQQVIYLLRELSREPEWPMELVCPSDSAVLEQARDLPMVCHPLPLRGDLDPGFFFRLLRLIRSRQPDVVHVHSRRGADLWGGLAAKAGRSKAVLTRRVDNPESLLAARFKYGLYHRVAVISEAIRSVLLRQGVASGKMIRIPSAVDSTLYQGECDQAWFRKELHLGPKDQPVGMIAQFIRRKGHSHLVQALPQILHHCPRAQFIFLGKGPLESEIRGQARRTGVLDRIRFAGFRNDLERLLPCLELVIHPASREGLGLSLLQAAAAGVPLLAYQAGGVPEVVRDNVNGRLVPWDDVGSLAQAAIQLLSDREWAATLGRAGRQIVEREFCVSAMAEAYKELYLEVAFETA